MFTKNRLFWYSALIIFTLSIVTNALFLHKIGYRTEPDSVGYIRVAKNFIEHGALLENDYELGTLIPFTERMPAYPLFLAGIYKIFGEKPYSLWIVAVFNYFFLTISALLIFLLAGYTFNLRVGIIAGLLAAFDPWAKLVGHMILTDSMFYMAVTFSFLLGVYTLKNQDNSKGINFFLWGMSIGLATMVRPVLNYFWMVLIPFFIYNYKLKRGLYYFIVCFLGIIIFTGSWLYRNYTFAGFFGLQSANGIVLLYGNNNLTRYSTKEDYESNHRLARARDVIASGVNPMKLMTPIQKELGLSSYELNDLLRKIGIENIVENPLKFSLIYCKNWIKTVTTLFNVGSTKGVGSTSPSCVVWAEKIASFVLFLLFPIAGFLIAWKRNYSKSILIFFVVTIFYFISLTALLKGSFRYRLPLHGIFWALDAVVILSFIDKLMASFKSGKLSLLLSKGK